MSKELDTLLWEIEKRGGRITTFELRAPGMPAQYQRALKQLRERLALEGITLTFAEKIENQKGNSTYRLIKNAPERVSPDPVCFKTQGALFPDNNQFNAA